MLKVSCCYKCSERQIGCHGMCKDYMEEVNKNNKIKEEINKKKEFETTMIDVKKQAIKNMRNVKSPNGILGMHKK